MNYKSNVYSRINYSNRFRILKRLFVPFLIGLALGIFAYIFRSYTLGKILAVFAAIGIVPCFIYAYVLVILHWKDRYVGNHSTLWGVLILIESSGWMKLVYIFRHLIPDLRSSGRYELANQSLKLTGRAGGDSER